MTGTLTSEDPLLRPVPFLSSVMQVEPQWIDYNGHLNMAYYNVMFDRAIDELWLKLGIGPAYMRERHGSTFTAECHVRYLREIHQGDPVQIAIILVAADEKRLHTFEELRQASERLHRFADISSVEAFLEELAARDPQALIHLDDSSADEKAVQKLVLWTPGDGPTVYGNYAAMLDETAPDDAMSMTTVLPEKWKSSWDNNTGTLLKPFRFAGSPPPDTGTFAGAVPTQFRPLAPTDCGADVGRLQALIRSGGPADAAVKDPEE